MDGLLQLAIACLFLAPIVGAIASAAGRPWGNWSTAGAAGAWFLLIVFTSGVSGPLVGITAMLLATVAIAEALLGDELRRRRQAHRPDGAIRAASALIGLMPSGIVFVFLMLVFSAWISAIS